ncbi:MAG: lactam utilization protein LamB [Subtercola sp.]|jgi:UPF0271 protein|nr:lactam utilization protein LamB [Subtercola sp.]
MLRMDLNADAGESFGRWKLGDDHALFQVVTTVNIACGYHAGDPANMREAIIGARDAGVSAGAHPGYPDLLGFGRRAMPVSDSDTIDYILYQVGALDAIARSEGVQLTHVKPHGSLMGAICRAPELAVSLVTSLQEIWPGRAFVLSPSPASHALEGAGLLVTPENAADQEFDADGLNIVEPRPQWKDPAKVAEQALRMVNGTALNVAGREIEMKVRSICVHGDRPNVVDIAKAVRLHLEASGVLVQSMYGTPL